jgi:subtilase family serine protease
MAARLGCEKVKEGIMIDGVRALARRAVPLSLATLIGTGVAASAPAAAPAVLQFVPLVAVAPDDPAGTAAGTPACTSPAPIKTYTFYHCYTPADIYSAYGVDAVHQAGWTGKGQTIVIVDSYGSPTAQQDLDFFSTTFGLPKTEIQVFFPNGSPAYSTTAVRGAEVGWAFETSLDLQWAHAIAPDAKLVLVAANPAETEGVQGFPSIFAGEEWAIQHFPGSVLSQSFAVTEQSFRGSSVFPQLSKFDQVYQDAVTNHVTVFGSAGDSGTSNVIDPLGSKLVPFPTVVWPSSDPLVTSAGGTWLQSGWRWNPTVQASTYYGCLAAGTAFNTCAAPYLSYTTGAGRTEAVWKEDWLPAATGGGRSSIFSNPSFQSGINQSVLQGARGLPDLSWNAAVDGGVLVYTSFPGTRLGWHTVGGTSASSPQLAALTALASQAAGKPVGYLNPLLYRLPSSDFRDILPETFGSGAGVTTLESNAQYGTGIPGSSTTSGWDLTTGFGTPVALNYVTDLAALVQGGP